MSRAQPAERLSRYRKRVRAGFPPVISEGDSWFDYPLFLNLIDRIDDAARFAHFRLERSADTVANMIGTESARRSLRESVAEERALCLLFSGGGNDLADAAPRLFRDGTFEDPADHLVPAATDRVFAELDRAYRAMVADIGPLVPIFAHGYDFFQPSPRAVKAFDIVGITGPWIHPNMVAADITDAGIQRGIAAELVRRFNNMLAGIESDHPLDFVHVDLCGTLDIEHEWANEIHPTREGFEKVADAFLEVLMQRLPDIQSKRMHRRLAADE